MYLVSWQQDCNTCTRALQRRQRHDVGVQKISLRVGWWSSVERARVETHWRQASNVRRAARILLDRCDEGFVAFTRLRKKGVRRRRTLDFGGEGSIGRRGAAFGRRDGTLVGCQTVLDELRIRVLEVVVLFDKVIVFGDTTSPAQAPVSNKSIEDATIEFERLVEATIQIVQSHLVLVLVLEQQAEMTSDGKKEIVVERRKMLELAAKYLGYKALVGYFTRQLRCYAVLSILGEDVLGKFTDPFLEKRSNDAGVVQISLV